MIHSQTQVILTVGENSVNATLADNEATKELKQLLAEGSITVKMSDYGGFEKVGQLPQSFTTSDSRITTTAGDIMLYQGDNIVIFYGSNTWSYTPLGKIDDISVEALKDFLGAGAISLRISLDETTEIADEVCSDADNADAVFDLQGNKLARIQLKPGLYIVDGKKILKK
ncbi:MAG: hypothetical protein K2K82_06635 [Muribaculaceae bacterium]|nr:hypothetical protein [Muribaculaceae bacterium]